MRILLTALILAAGCTPDKGKLTYTLPGAPVSVPEREGLPPVEAEPEVVSFKNIQSEILIPKCAECHRWVNDEARTLRKLVPGDPDASELFQVVESGEMPEDAAPLSTAELELIRAYILSLKP